MNNKELLESKRVLKWPVGLPGDAPDIVGGGPIAHVADGFVWTIEPQGSTKVWRKVLVYGTGDPVPADAVHIGTMMMGPFVWHVFEVQGE